MVLADIRSGLDKFLDPLDSQTYQNTYRVQKRDSLLKPAKSLGTRANSIWKMAQYIVATYDGKEDKPIEDYIKGWSILVKHSKDQFLIIQLDETDNWAMYDSYCNFMGGNEFIESYFDEHSVQIGAKGGLNPVQKVYFGTPGGGKSRTVKDWLKARGVKKEQIFRTTFHPDTDYASFVGSYKPIMKGDRILYEYVPQVFTEAYIAAWNNLESKTEVYLVIEELNRGNCAQIFGDLFQLLDRKGGISEYPIKADRDLKQYLLTAKDDSGDSVLKNMDGIENGDLLLPSNFNIIATMNTSDQSLFPMDSAFKRRWDWEYVPIDYDNEASKFHITLRSGKKYDWMSFLDKVNERIVDVTDSEDKQLGNFFIKESIDEDGFKSKVLFYLWSEICKEEYKTNKNFFRSTSPDGSIIEFSFNDLFDLRKKKDISLEGFMRYLGVEEAKDGDTEDAEEVD